MALTRVLIAVILVQAALSFYVQATQLNELGFRRHEALRCQGHYEESSISGVAAVSVCERKCQKAPECRAFSIQQTGDKAGAHACFLFGEQAQCSAASGWVSGFKDTRCSHVDEREFMHLSCPSGTVIEGVVFASFGTPTGSCGSFQVGHCHDNMTRQIIEDICLGENSCKLSASIDVFADVCAFSTKWLKVQVTCSAGSSFFEDVYFNQWSNSTWAASLEQISERQLAWREALANVEEYDAGKFAGRGIVMVAGGRYLETAITSIKMLRHYGCTLPVEVWHLGASEVSAAESLYLATMGATTRDFERYVDESLLKPIAANVGLRLFQLKPLAILYSSFRDVLLLDSDNSPLRDPTYMFESPEFQQYGAVFWPDYWKTTPENPIWAIVDRYAANTWEQESGQIMVNKEASWTALNLCLHFNNEFYMRLLNGDKDTFRFAWIASSTPYFMIEALPTAVGALKEKHAAEAQGFCGHSMLQYDTEGNALFLHHNQLKSAVLPAGENFRYQKALVSKSGSPVHATPVAGLQLSKVIIPCTDVRSTELPYVDEEQTVVTESNLLEFEQVFLQATQAVSAELSGSQTSITVDDMHPFFTPLKSNPHVTMDLKQLSAQARVASKAQSKKMVRRGMNETCIEGLEYEAVPGTMTSDRQCMPLTVCQSYEYEAIAATTTSDRLCRRITSCQANYDPFEQEIAPATLTSDTVCQKKSCACSGQVHPILSISKPGYGSYCNDWIQGAASFCYVDSSCPSAVYEETTGLFFTACTCGLLSAGGASCTTLQVGYSYELVAQGDVGSGCSSDWFEFSTARDATYVIAQLAGDLQVCQQACDASDRCVGIQLESLQDDTVMCTLLSNVGHRVPTMAVTRSFIAVQYRANVMSYGTNRFANAFDPNYQVFVVEDVSDPNACLDLCGTNTFCQAAHISVCPATGNNYCIGLSVPGEFVFDDTALNIALMKTYPPVLPFEHKFIVRTKAKTATDPSFEMGSALSYDVSKFAGAFSPAPAITLVEGVKYTFQLSNVDLSAPFIITESAVGGPTSTAIALNVDQFGAFATGSQVVHFTPTSATPRTLFYESHNEDYVGGRISIVAPAKVDSTFCDEPTTTTTTAPPSTTTTTPAMSLEAPGFRLVTPDGVNRFSTAFVADRKLFPLETPTLSEALTECTMRCTADSACRGFYLINLPGMYTCTGLDNLGTLVATQLPIHSFTKL